MSNWIRGRNDTAFLISRHSVSESDHNTASGRCYVDLTDGPSRTSELQFALCPHICLPFSVFPIWLVISCLFLTSSSGSTPDSRMDKQDDRVLTDNLLDILSLTFIWWPLFVDLALTNSKMPRKKPDEKTRSYPKRRSMDPTGSSKFKSANLCEVFILHG